MRSVLLPLVLAVVAIVATSNAGAQLSVGESRTLDDAMTLANLRPEDLRGVAAPAGARGAHLAAVRDPLVGLNEAAARHARATGDEATMLRAAYGLLGGAAGKGAGGKVAEVPSSVPEPMRRPVGALVAAIAEANAEIRAATARLSPDERRTLIEALPRLAADDAAFPLDFAKTPAPEFARVRRLLDLVDADRIERVGIALADAVQEAVPELQRMRNKHVPTVRFRAQGVVVELSGSGPDVHSRRDVGLCVDLGGDDVYTGRYGAGVGYAAVCLDLGGNDRYRGPDVNLGAGLLGIGILMDEGGDDVYGVRSVGLGCGLAGLGLLVDAGGNDRYRTLGLGLGVGARGIGLVSDRLGDDVYAAGRDGEGFGTLGGVGWSVDGAGDDVYRGGEGVQATGRETGFGLLTDLAGDDLYRAASGQAWADGGYASLGDLRGDDVYVAARGQGLASAGGVAFLIEGGGDDSYLLTQGPGQAAAFGGLAVLLDRAGDDVYGGTDGSPAAAFAGGVAILLEAEGDDRYLASSPFRREGDGVSLWADGNGRDRYGDGRGDAQAAAGDAHTAYDAYGASEPRNPPEAPTPGSLPIPPVAELASLRRQATDGPDRGAALARLVGIGEPALESLATDPDGGPAFVAVASRMGPAAASVVARLATSGDPRLVRTALETAGFVPIPSEAVVAALDRSETSEAATEAAGRARIAAAVPALIRRAAGDRPRAALVALARIGDPQAAATGAARIDHPDLLTRQAAFRVALLEPTVAFSTGRRLAGNSDGFQQRIGLALLGAVGTPEALAAVAPSLKGSRDAKIGALLALDGHVPPDLIAAVEALRRDADPLVRAVAERVDAG